MRQIPAAVTVVTTSPDGRQGLTVTAVSSVSADPPQLLVCVNRETRSAAAISAAGRFGVNYLDADHVDLARGVRRTRPTTTRNGSAWPVGSTARPAPPCCRTRSSPSTAAVVNEIHSGTHTIFIGQVTHIRAHDGQPLLYQRGAFTTTTDASLGLG